MSGLVRISVLQCLIMLMAIISGIAVQIRQPGQHYLGRPRGREDKHASRVAVQAGRLPFSGGRREGANITARRASRDAMRKVRRPRHYSASSSWSFYCRSYDSQAKSWSTCPIKDFSGVSPSQTAEARSISNASTVLNSQECLDAVGQGKWMKSAAKLGRDSLGSNSRYAGDSFFLGPVSSVQGEPAQVRSAPHAKRHTAGSQHKSPEFVWQPSNEISECPGYEWLDRKSVSDCLRQTWIAFWGDSTTRLAFSALVDFLGEGIEEQDFPTHDFAYKEHQACRVQHRCHSAVHFPNRGITLTFNFVTRVEYYPNMWETLQTYADKAQFPHLPLQRDQPDTVVMNSGPWEYYNYNGSHGWPGDEKYVSVFNAFLMQYWGKPTGIIPNLIILRNTACPQQQGNCEASGVSCIDAMDNVHTLQQQVVRSFVEKTGSTHIRYLNGAYLRDLPEDYHCSGETGYHLPSVITDQRINHALYALCVHN